MLRNIKKLSPFSLFLPSVGDSADLIVKDTKTTQEVDLSEVKKETGWDRVHRIFAKDEFGRLSLELQTIIEVACLSAFSGTLYGGMIHSREAYIEFIKNNQATAFRDHLEAKRRLQDSVTLSFAKGGFKWGWRLTLFCTTYITMTTTIATYRGKNGFLEHVIAGGTSGFLYKLQQGPKAWIVGGGLGMVLGAIGGIVTVSLLKATGMTMEEVRYWNYKWVNARHEAFNEAYKKKLEEEEDLLLKERKKRALSDSLDKVDVATNK